MTEQQQIKITNEDVTEYILTQVNDIILLRKQIKILQEDNRKLREAQTND